MRIKYFLLPIVFFALVYIAMIIKINIQVKGIKENINAADNCNQTSTSQFADGELVDTEYLFYRCLLSPDIQTLYMYVDKKTKRIVKAQIIPTNYESIVGAAPRFCTTGVSKTDIKNIYDICSIFINYDSLFTGYNEFFFSTPLTINNNKNLKEQIMQQTYTQNVDDFIE